LTDGSANDERVDDPANEEMIDDPASPEINDKFSDEMPRRKKLGVREFFLSKFGLLILVIRCLNFLSSSCQNQVEKDVGLISRMMTTVQKRKEATISALMIWFLKPSLTELPPADVLFQEGDGSTFFSISCVLCCCCCCLS
jgi:hypothetical protein